MDTSSWEWLEECEARSLVKQYLITLMAAGEAQAVEDLKTAMAARAEVSKAREQHLRARIQNIWKTQRHELAQELAATESVNTTHQSV